MTERTKRLAAREYERAALYPQLYPQFIADTLAQAEGLSGLTVIPTTLTEPYVSSRNLFRDIESHVIRVNAVDSLCPGHPLHKRYHVHAWRMTLSANVIFRVVHDVLGHYATGEPFESFQGENNAYNAHARAYVSSGAQSVLWSETMGQLAAYFAGGPNGTGAGFQGVQLPKVTL